MALYYGDTNGKYLPVVDISKKLVEKEYMKQISYVYMPHHKDSNVILTLISKLI